MTQWLQNLHWAKQLGLVAAVMLVCSSGAFVWFLFADWIHALNQNTNLNFNVGIDFTSMWIGLGALVVATVIAIRQRKQLVRIEHIAESLDLQRQLREQAPLFWGDSDEFTCYVPAQQYPKSERPSPQPVIKVGDYYALHTVDKLLDRRNLQLAWAFVEPSWAGEIDERCVFIGSSIANGALKRLEETERDFFDALPCWFVKRDTAMNLRAFDQQWASPADKFYLSAMTQGVVTDGEAHDWGLVARLTLDSGRKAFVIAGLHQYGTWTSSHVLEKAIIRDSAGTNPAIEHMLGREDFIAWTTGHFDNSTLRVVDEKTYIRELWFKGESGWEHCKPFPA